MTSFVRGLEMNDTSMRFEADRHDPELYEMVQSMNRITAMYVTNKRELETRKLYYDRILRVMTHEMRNSISPIVSLSQDLYEHPANYDSTASSEAIGIIRLQSESIKKFLDSYHALTHLPAPEQENIDASEFISKIRKSMEYLEENILSSKDIISYNVASGAVLFIDKGLLTQVLTNLLKNALEAVAEKRSSLIQEQNLENNKPKIEINADRYKPQISVTVTDTSDSSFITIEDNGCGFPQSIAANPFQPFFSTKENGNGIGLFLSRQIIRLHGGDIKIHNKTGKGITIHISLPHRNNGY